MAAARAGCLQCVRLLREKGASTDLVSERGRTAADWACETGHEGIAEYLRPRESPQRPSQVCGAQGRPEDGAKEN